MDRISVWRKQTEPGRDSVWFRVLKPSRMSLPFWLEFLKKLQFQLKKQKWAYGSKILVLLFKQHRQPLSANKYITLTEFPTEKTMKSSRILKHIYLSSFIFVRSDTCNYSFVYKSQSLFYNKISWRVKKKGKRTVLEN